MVKCHFCGTDMTFRDFGPYYPLYDVPGATVGYWECLNFNDGRHGDPRFRMDRLPARKGDYAVSLTARAIQGRTAWFIELTAENGDAAVGKEMFATKEEAEAAIMGLAKIGTH
jgi:hypothetical protein